MDRHSAKIKIWLETTDARYDLQQVAPDWIEPREPLPPALMAEIVAMHPGMDATVAVSVDGAIHRRAVILTRPLPNGTVAVVDRDD